MTITVSLPEPLTHWIESRIKAGDYASLSDYVGDLVGRDRELAQKVSALRALIDESEASGISPRALDEVFAEARARVQGETPALG